MDLKISWYSMLFATLSLSGLANAADEKKQDAPLTMSESESKIVMCGLYRGYKTNIPEDSVLALVCNGAVEVTDLNHKEKAVLKRDVIILSKQIKESAGSHVI